MARTAEGFTLDGVAANVQDAQAADYLLVTAVDDRQCLPIPDPGDHAGITLHPLETLDLGRRLANVEFSGVQVAADALVGEYGRAADQFERQLQVALVLHCAETVGVIDARVQ